MDRMLLIFCSLVSCIIIVNILFRFMEERYKRVFESENFYRFLPVASVLFITWINTFMVPALNMAAHFLLLGFSALFLYSGGKGGRIGRMAEVGAAYIMIAVSESLGMLFFDFLLELTGRTPQNLEILKSMETAFSKLVVLFLYYVVFGRFWKKTGLRTGKQYILYIIMFLYSVINIFAVSAISEEESPLILMMEAGSIIFSNMYMLYFVQFSDERNVYKYQVEMMEQKEKMRYESYEAQLEKYIEAVGMLHDMDKHIRQMEYMYQKNLIREASGYARQIGEILQSFMPVAYTDNAILNCLLTDKAKQAEKKGIVFCVEGFTGDINFMAPADITSLFGNLLDNGIAAAVKCESEKSVRLSVEASHDMVSVRSVNTVRGEVLIKDGMLAERGIGIMNMERCAEIYGGSVMYWQEGKEITCDIMLNRPEEKE